MRALVFPGQASQFVGMGREEYTQSALVRGLFDQANQVLGYDLTQIMFEGPEELLRQTRYSQPAVFLHSYALWELAGRPTADAVAGHSLGEYDALVIAGCLDFKTGLQLVNIRAQLMWSAASQGVSGSMAAIIGLKESEIQTICHQINSERGSVIVLANYNSPVQIVISGQTEAVIDACQRCRITGARQTVTLPVSGAFHSPLMQTAQDEFQPAVESVELRPAQTPFYSSVGGRRLTSIAGIKVTLKLQLTGPVLWCQTVERMVLDGITEFIEIGPGCVLKRLIRETVPNIPVRNINSFASAHSFKA